MPIALILAAAALALAPAAKPERRCGWLQNPTPANWYLTDRDGDWTLSVQGGAEAIGMDSLPDMAKRGWVVTNGASYGYGCACMTMTIERGSGQVTRIASATPLPLRQCRADKRLPRP